MSDMMFYASLLLIGTLISSLSQVMLKKATERKYSSPISEYLNPMVIGAYVIFLGVTFLSIYAYRGIPLSMGAVLESSSYIYVMFFGWYFFDEAISRRKIFGLLMILFGIGVFFFEC